MSQAQSVPYASQEDFLAAAQALLPPGDAWAQEDAALLTTLLNARAASAARVHARVANLTEAEQFPWLSEDLLPDWETAYGLPDPCTPLSATVAERQAALGAKIAATGGQSKAVFIAVAAALGFAVTITEFTPWIFGSSTFGEPLYGQAWQWAWQVNVPGTDPTGQLACRLNRLKPAHTILIMNFEG